MNTNIQELIDRVKNSKTVIKSPKTYAASDILAAKKVLDRIASAPTLGEVMSVKPVIKIINLSS